MIKNLVSWAIMPIAIIILVNIQSEAQTEQSQQEYLRLTPPIDQLLRMEKKQSYTVGGNTITRTSLYHIIFSDTDKDNIIGYDIVAELVSNEIDGDPKLLNILTNSHQKIGAMHHFTYDRIDGTLMLTNGDAIWADFMRNIDQIQANAGPRSEKEQKRDQKFLENLKNIPSEKRELVLAEDMNVILAFIGEDLSELDHRIDGGDIIVEKQNILQDGKIIDTNMYRISKKTGLVHIFDHILRPNNSDKHIVSTHYKITAAAQER